eukprot:8855878-Pyramimonas_sp.AAC.2
MSQLLKKASGRVSGPLNRTLPTLIEELEADPYASDDALQVGPPDPLQTPSRAPEELDADPYASDDALQAGFPARSTSP